MLLSSKEVKLVSHVNSSYIASSYRLDYMLSRVLETQCALHNLYPTGCAQVLKLQLCGKLYC